MDLPDPDGQLGIVAALDHPIRRALFRFLTESGAWIGRDEAARATAVPRSVAAFHLDKLAEAGAVDVRFERTSGRTGPGAGRPAKLYRRHFDEVTVSLPDRHYDLAGSVLATAAAESVRNAEPITDCLHRAAHRAGVEVGIGSADAGDGEAVLEVLRRQGYEPVTLPNGEVALGNCPFHRLAEQERELVCGMNLDFLGGVLEAVGATGLDARLSPEPGFCCVRLSGG